MLIISDGERSGIYGLYPVLFPKKSTIHVIDWLKYGKLVNIFVAVNLLFLAYFIILLTCSPKTVDQQYNIAFSLFDIYILIKVKAILPKIKIKKVPVSRLTMGVAPISVWLDYCLIGVNGVILHYITMEVATTSLIRNGAIILQVGFFLYAVMPFVVYVKFLQSEKKLIRSD